MDEGQKGNRRLYESTRSNKYTYGLNPAAGYTFLTSENGIFCRICHMLDHKTRSQKFLKFETIQSFFSSYDEMKLVINNRKKNWKNSQILEIKQHTLKQPISHIRHHKERN